MIYRLTISTFKKEDPAASHYYGRIRYANQEHDLLDKEGDCIGFETRTAIVKAAGIWFRNHRPRPRRRTDRLEILYK